MANTYKALSTVTVGAGGAANMSFSNIPQTYTDLKIVISARNSNAGTDATRVQLRFNGASTDANLTFRRLYGNGSSAASDSGSTGHIAWSNQSGSTANTFSNIEVYIPNYANSNPKSFSADGGNENNQIQAYFGMFADLWNSTSPITSITIFSEGGENWLQYTTATLYGVFNADVSSAPATPTIGTATAGNAQASITFTPVSNAASYTMTSTPDSITATGASSPIVVTGLTNNTAYTFKVKSNNPFGSSAESAASNSVTPVGVFNAIATTTLGSNTTTVTFSNIPQTYKHLVVRAYTKPTNVGLYLGQGSIRAYVNGSNSGYRFSRSYGNGRDGGSGDYSAQVYLDTFNTVEWWLNTYTDTNLTKQLSSISSWVSQTSVSGGNGVMQISNNDATGGTAAVTSITFTNTDGWQFASGSIFMLYGVGE